MRNYRKHIDDFFREKLGAYSETPPPEVWDDLEKRLDGLTTVTPASPYRWLWHVAIVSILLLLGVSVTRKMSDSPTTKNGEIAQNNTTAAKTGTTSTIAATNGVAPTASGNTVTANTVATNSSIQTASIQTANNDLKNNKQVNNNNTANNSTLIVANNTQHDHYSSKTPASAKQTAANNHKPNASRTTEQPDNTTNTYAASYNNGKNTKHGPATDDANDNNQVITSPNNALSGTVKSASSPTQAKKDDATTKTNAAGKPAAPKPMAKKDQKHTNSIFPRFEYGIKGGVEAGLTDGAANKLVVSPYLQYNLSQKFAVMLQPAIKAAMLSNKNIGTSQDYYSLNEDGKITQDEDIITTHTVGGTAIDTHHTRYTYTQTHTNITKSNTFDGTYSEVELPVLLKYNLSKKLSVYGGVNLVYSRLMGVKEHTTTQQNVLATKDTTVISVNTGTDPSQLPKNIITYSGTPVSQYNGPAYPGTPQAQLRTGYMVGFSYMCGKKLMIDALMQQTPAPADVRGGYNVNTPLSSPYIRLSIGYKIK